MVLGKDLKESVRCTYLSDISSVYKITWARCSMEDCRTKQDYHAIQIATRKKKQKKTIDLQENTSPILQGTLHKGELKESHTCLASWQLSSFKL